MIIAIDGPAGTGKSTIASLIAKTLGITYLNSGSFYRALTLSLVDSNDKTLSNAISELNHCTQSQLSDTSDENLKYKNIIVNFCKNQKLDYVNGRLCLNGRDVEDELHSDRVSKYVAQVSAIVPIRHFVNERMHEIVKSLDIVCEGRDMTTVVFPNAEYKFFLDASLDAQASRRFNQGVSNMTLGEIKAAIKKRDEIDKNKAEGALKIAPDAKYIDTTDLTISQVCGIILETIKKQQALQKV